MQNPKHENDRKHSMILLVDDSELDILVNTTILLTHGFAEKVVSKQSGRQAINFLKECVKNETPFPEIILLDINMPIMNGFTFLENFEMLPISKRNNSKIIVTTSSDELSDIEKVRAFDSVLGYIVKPLEHLQLKKLLS